MKKDAANRWGSGLTRRMSVIVLGVLLQAQARAEEPLSLPVMPDPPARSGVHPWLEQILAEERHRHESYGDVILRHEAELQLTDEQIGRIWRLHQANQQRIQAIAAKLQDATDWAHALFLDPTKDEASIRQAARSHGVAFDELVNTALRTRQDIHAVLTPAQQAKLPTLGRPSPSH